MSFSTGDSRNEFSYFDDSDTLYIELKSHQICETRDLDENTILDRDASGNILGITLEQPALEQT